MRYSALLRTFHVLRSSRLRLPKGDRTRPLIIALALGFSMEAPAQLYWTGSTSNNWGATNWVDAFSGGASASFSDGVDVFFTDVSGGANLSTTLGANRTINSLTVNGTLSGPLTIAGNTLTINNGLNLSAAANTVAISSAITLGGDQIWILSPTNPLTVTGAISGSTSELTVDGSGGGSMSIGNTTNNSYNIGHISLINGATLTSTQDNSFNDYNTSLNLAAGTTYDAGSFADAFAGLGGGGVLMNANATLDLRPNTGETFLFDGSFSGTEPTHFQITAGSAQRDLVSGIQLFDVALSGTGNLQVLNGTGGFVGANGSMNLAVGTINIGRSDTATMSAGNLATLLLDSSTGNHATQNRLDDLEQINLRTGSQLRIVGNGGALTTEDVGPLSLTVHNTGTPHAFVTLEDGGAGVALASDSLVRATGSSMLIRGDGLGSGAAGAGVTTLTFDTAPTLSAAGSGSGTGLNIMPYAVGDASASGLGTDFVTYGANGVRPLSAADYAAAIASGANVELTSAPAALGANADLLALKLSGAGVTLDLGGNTLDVQNGAILSSGSAASGITNGTLTFGAEPEAFLHLPSDFTLAAGIADNGSALSVVKTGAGTLTITAAQTYTGGTYLNEGNTIIIGSDLLATNRTNLNGVLDLSNASTTHTAIGMLSG